jgi:hypothetical protein
MVHCRDENCVVHERGQMHHVPLPQCNANTAEGLSPACAGGHLEGLSYAVAYVWVQQLLAQLQLKE